MARALHSPAISLFAGAGGMDIGVEEAGFKTVCAIESDPHCAATLRRNGPRKAVWQADVRVIDPQRVLDVLQLRPGEVGLLHGGPPCQPFSQIGKRGGMDDPRGALIFEVLRFARVLRPLAVLVEQVPNFLRTRTPAGRHLLEELRDEFHTLGYDMHVDVVDAQAHGVAQRRRRALFVCVPAGAPFAFGPPNGKAKTVGAALRGLPVPSAPDEAPPVANHIDVTPARDRERIAYVPEGLWLAKVPGVPADILRNLTRKDTTKYRRLHRQGIAPTLRCGEALYHPLEDRYITPREAARLQGFPDRHVFEGPIRRRTGRVCPFTRTTCDGGGNRDMARVAASDPAPHRPCSRRGRILPSENTLPAGVRGVAAWGGGAYHARHRFGDLPSRDEDGEPAARGRAA